MAKTEIDLTGFADATVTATEPIKRKSPATKLANPFEAKVQASWANRSTGEDGKARGEALETPPLTEAQQEAVKRALVRAGKALGLGVEKELVPSRFGKKVWRFQAAELRQYKRKAADTDAPEDTEQDNSEDAPEGAGQDNSEDTGQPTEGSQEPATV